MHKGVIVTWIINLTITYDNRHLFTFLLCAGHELNEQDTIEREQCKETPGEEAMRHSKRRYLFGRE